MQSGPRNPPLYLRAGTLVGAASGIIATLVQLPLHSPSDILFNSASVTFGSLAAGSVAGYMWRELSKRGFSIWVIAGIWFGVFDIVVLFAALGETQLDRTLSYGVPLAAIIFAATCFITPWLARRPKLLTTPVVIVVTVGAIGLGLGLAGMGDAPSGSLSLPPRAS